MSHVTKTTVPRGPHHESVADRRLSLAIPAAGTLLVYCPRHAAGCIFNEHSGRWMIQVPVAPVDFLKTLECAHIELPDAALETWLGSIHAVTREIEGGKSH